MTSTELTELKEEINKLSTIFNNLFERLEYGNSTADKYKYLHQELGAKYSVTSIKRLLQPENLYWRKGKNGEQLSYNPIKLKKKLENIIHRTREILGESDNIDTSKVQSKSELHLDKQYDVYYWDWNMKPAFKDNLKGSVVKGELYLSDELNVNDARLILANKKELTGKILKTPKVQNGNYNKIIHFKGLDASTPKLFLSLFIENSDKAPIIGSFLTYDEKKFHPMVGTVYVISKEFQDLLSNDNYNFEIQKITHSLFQQTIIRRNNRLKYIEDSCTVFTNQLQDKTFIGYFFKVQSESLETFLLTLYEGGRAIIKFKTRSYQGVYRLLGDVFWFDFDYQYDWQVFRFRSHFKRDVRNGWFFGVGSGIDRGLMQPFTNRIAFQEVESTELNKLEISSKNIEKDKIEKLFESLPILKDFFSGIANNQSEIIDNEKYTETPDFLKRIGIVDTNVETFSSFKNFEMIRIFAGNYEIYSVSRDTKTINKKDEFEFFQINKCPLKINGDGTVIMKGYEKKYYGFAKISDSRLIINFENIIYDKSKTNENDINVNCFLIIYFKVRLVGNDKSRFSDVSVGISQRFMGDLPESRTELLCKTDVDFEKNEYQDYKFLDEEDFKWSKFKNENEHIAKFLSGRINRLIVHNNTSLKTIRQRQDEFRLLYAHAALAFIGKTSSKEQFIEYFYNAILHSFGEELSDKDLFNQLKTEFDSINENIYWKSITKERVLILKDYFEAKLKQQKLQSGNNSNLTHT